MSTLAILRTKLNRELKIDPNNKIWSLEEKDQAINDAYDQIQRDGEYNWRENQTSTTVSLVANTQEYNLPSDFVRLEAIIIDNYPMHKKNYVDVQRLSNTSASKPSEYYLYGSKYGFYPKPDSTYTINFIYRKSLPTITSLVDSTFSDSYDRAIAKYAAFIIFSTTRGNEGVANTKLNDYEREINRLRLKYQLQDHSNLSFQFSRHDKSNNQSDKALYY